jgi:hypothetical protein
MGESQAAALSKAESGFLKSVVEQTYVLGAPHPIGEQLVKRGLLLKPDSPTGPYCVTVAGLLAATDERHKQSPSDAS